MPGEACQRYTKQQNHGRGRLRNDNQIDRQIEARDQCCVDYLPRERELADAIPSHFRHMKEPASIGSDGIGTA